MIRIQINNVNPVAWTLNGLEKQYRRQDRNKLVDFIKPLVDQDDSVLDIGVGGAIEIRLLRESGLKNKIDVCDCQTDVLDFINKKKNLSVNKSFLYDIINDITLADKSYDVVLGLELIEHLEDPKKAIESMIRIARKKVIISCPYKNSFKTRQHLWSIDENDLKHFSDKYLVYKIISEKTDYLFAAYYV